MAANDSGRLVGRVALVTGAGSGIGAATARLLAAQGAVVYCADRDQAACSGTTGQIDGAGAALFALQHGSEEAAFRALEAGPAGGRFAEPEDVARAIVFLASDDAAVITGVELPVDSGYLL